MSKNNKAQSKSRRSGNSQSGVKRKRGKESNSQNSTRKIRAREEGKNANAQQSKVFTEEAKDNLRIYTKLHTIYEEEGITQKTHQFLTRITKRKVSVHAFHL